MPKVGSLVRVRGRDWQVLPESEEDFLVLKPVGGGDAEVAGVFPHLEDVAPAHFPPPDLGDDGGLVAPRLLFEALRLSLRSSGGPFRSFGHLGVSPRPYQLVPLLMALRLDPVRLLIADDVGIGKTIEAALIAKEKMSAGEIDRLAVLCPPHLATQWQKELLDKFHIEAEVVLPSTVSRLERDARYDQSVFDVHSNVVVSIDYIKSPAKRHAFLKSCPDFVIVDEAHTCGPGYERRGHQYRYELVQEIAADASRHLVLVTATPHSGKEDAFRSLLGLVDPALSELPSDLSGRENEKHRRRLARHFVQRKRPDIKAYLGSETIFPERLPPAEIAYELSDPYARLFDEIVDLVHGVAKEGTNGQQARIRWWSALALLRSTASSPAAALATLKARSATAETTTAADADEVGRRSVLDLVDDESEETMDVSPGADFNVVSSEDAALRKRLAKLIPLAEALHGDDDAKMLRTAEAIEGLLKEGLRPIIFCRFIPTAEYLAAELRKRLKDTRVEAITGLIPPAERESRVEEFAESDRRVLVSTDCLSEGINLQHHFDSVVHYDLSWNPTRQEQREGRVDRFGQKSPYVKVITIYGTDNYIDGIVLEVLLKKHSEIYDSLGVSVPMPAETERVVEAMMNSLLSRERAESAVEQMRLFERDFGEQRKAIYAEWERAAADERRSRTLFAQHAIRPDEVAVELQEVQRSIGSSDDVRWFVRSALGFAGLSTVDEEDGSLVADLSNAPYEIRSSVGTRLRARFDLPVSDREVYIDRTHPLVEQLSSFVLEGALRSAKNEGSIARIGVVRSSELEASKMLLVLRFRFQLGIGRENLLAEEAVATVISGGPDTPSTDEALAESVLASDRHEPMEAEEARRHLRPALQSLGEMASNLDEEAHDRGSRLLASFERVRKSVGLRSSYQVDPHLPPDVLGVFLYLPPDDS